MKQIRKKMKIFLNEFDWSSYRFIRNVKSRILQLKRLFVVPKLPQNPDGKILIHLGCGEINSPEFINVDFRRAPHVHYVCDVTDLSIFPNNYADLVYACHLLEHVFPEHHKKVLWEWKRILKNGGILRLSVPDFEKLILIYKICDNDIESIRAPLMGYEGEYIHHCMIFNYKYLSNILSDIGFIDITEWDPEKVNNHNFDDWASKKIQRNNKEFHISLNMQAVKRE